MRTCAGLAFLVPVLAMALPMAALADDTPCNTTITGEFDNVVAIPGGTCTLSAATVDGNVRAEDGSNLVISLGTVGGSVQGEWGASIAVIGTVVEGDVQCEGAVGPNGCQVTTANVGGNIQSDAANGGFVNVVGNRVGGDVQVFDSLVPSFISLNTIGGNLQCKENDPAPDPAGLAPTNTVGGNKEDQCSEGFGF